VRACAITDDRRSGVILWKIAAPCAVAWLDSRSTPIIADCACPSRRPRGCDNANTGDTLRIAHTVVLSGLGARFTRHNDAAGDLGWAVSIGRVLCAFDPQLSWRWAERRPVFVRRRRS
jgi:hypothetical protein